MGKEERPAFSAGFSIALLVFLSVPFAIKSVVYAEPWPAIILPSGAIKITVDNGVAHFPVTSVAVIGPDGRYQPADPRQLFSPVPVHYLFSILGCRLGQDTRPYRELVFKRGPFHTWRLPRVPPTDTEQRTARDWLRVGVERTGLHGDKISVRSQMVSVAMQSGQELGREDANETLVPLR
jgi:hypothetical protein